MISRAALLNRLQPEEEQALIESTAVEAGAADQLAAHDLRFLRQYLAGLIGHLHRLLQRSLGWQLDDAQAVALIFGGHEARRDRDKRQAGEHHTPQHRAHQQTTTMDGALQQPPIGGCHAVELAVEAREDRLEIGAHHGAEGAEQQQPQPAAKEVAIAGTQGSADQRPGAAAGIGLAAPQ